MRIFVAMPGEYPEGKMPAGQVKRHLLETTRSELAHTLPDEDIKLIFELEKHLAGSIPASMFSEAAESDVFIADVTGGNPTVFLELGVRWSFRENVTLLITQDEEPPFGVASARITRYSADLDHLAHARTALVEGVLRGRESGHCDSLVLRDTSARLLKPDRVRDLEDRLEQLRRRYVRDVVKLCAHVEDELRNQHLPGVLELAGPSPRVLHDLVATKRRLADAALGGGRCQEAKQLLQDAHLLTGNVDLESLDDEELARATSELGCLVEAAEQLRARLGAAMEGQ